MKKAYLTNTPTPPPNQDSAATQSPPPNPTQPHELNSLRGTDGCANAWIDDQTHILSAPKWEGDFLRDYTLPEASLSSLCSSGYKN